jgi:putative phosphoribosyl transferase
VEVRVKIFQNRRSAGSKLARALEEHVETGPVVVALPRGGVPVADEIARAFDAPLDVLIVRKLGVPGHEELAMGAIATGEVRILNESILEQLNLGEEDIAQVEARERGELRRREARYRGSAPPVDVSNRAVIVVDDGIATGATMRAAVQSLRLRGAKRIIVATPVAPPDVVEWLTEDGITCVCLATPEPFYGVGAWYHDFSQTSDEEVEEILRRSNMPTTRGQAVGHTTPTQRR